MNSILSRNVIELLDRKYSFVESATDDLFLLDLEQFIGFLHQSEMVNPFAEKLVKDVKSHLERYRSKVEIETEKAVEVRDMLIERYPEMDDSRMEHPEGVIDSTVYELSFANFNNLVAGTRTRFGYYVSLGLYSDDSSVAALIWILRTKINSHQGLDAPPEHRIDKEIEYKLQDLESLHNHTHREWINYQRVSAGRALVELTDIVQNINPEPKDETEFRRMSTLEKLNHAAERIYTESDYRPIRAMVYGRSEEPDWSRSNDTKRSEILTKSKILLKRVYEGIRKEIGTTQLYLQLLNRYRLRSQWYNHSHLRDLVAGTRGGFRRNREDMLTKDLALFLFDSGVTALYRTRFGKHEVDLLEIDVEAPIFIEAKVYKDSRAKKELIDGVAQLHSYLSNLEGYKPIREAYYVVFRLAGPIYEFPEMVSTNRFQIFPVVVDLGLSNESGRRQPKPILITKEQVLSEIDRDALPLQQKEKQSQPGRSSASSAEKTIRS